MIQLSDLDVCLCWAWAFWEALSYSSSLLGGVANEPCDSTSCWSWAASSRLQKFTTLLTPACVCVCVCVCVLPLLLMFSLCSTASFENQGSLTQAVPVAGFQWPHQLGVVEIWWLALADDVYTPPPVSARQFGNYGCVCVCVWCKGDKQ